MYVTAQPTVVSLGQVPCRLSQIFSSMIEWRNFHFRFHVKQALLLMAQRKSLRSQLVPNLLTHIGKARLPDSIPARHQSAGDQIWDHTTGDHTCDEIRDRTTGDQVGDEVRNQTGEQTTSDEAADHDGGVWMLLADCASHVNKINTNVITEYWRRQTESADGECYCHTNHPKLGLNEPSFGLVFFQFV